jgi:hypothetical protein
MLNGDESSGSWLEESDGPLNGRVVNLIDMLSCERLKALHWSKAERVQGSAMVRAKPVSQTLEEYACGAAQSL